MSYCVCLAEQAAQQGSTLNMDELPYLYLASPHYVKSVLDLLNLFAKPRIKDVSEMSKTIDRIRYSRRFNIFICFTMDGCGG